MGFFNIHHACSRVDSPKICSILLEDLCLKVQWNLIYTYASTRTITMLILATVLSSVVSMVSSPHQASGEVCISDSNNYANAITTCINQQNSNSHDHSTTKSRTPFLLALPFP
jgi:hypothetical protein